MQIKLGDKIKELRKRDGRKQEDLANALGVTNQAVSRWERDECYPDLELLPSIANYFGISIDELFGYNNERSKKVDVLVSQINDMNYQNNGVNINIDKCIALAREAMIEFPGNEKIMLCLASVLYNAGYVRYGEYHLIDEEDTMFMTPKDIEAMQSGGKQLHFMKNCCEHLKQAICGIKRLENSRSFI